MTAEERERYDVYELGDFKLVGGTVLPGAKIAYRTWGTLNAEKSNAIMYPTWYSGMRLPQLCMHLYV